MQGHKAEPNSQWLVQRPAPKQKINTVQTRGDKLTQKGLGKTNKQCSEKQRRNKKGIATKRQMKREDHKKK